MANGIINIDFDKAYTAVNKALPARPTDTASNYSDEWLTTTSVGTLFTDADSTLTTFEQTVNAMRTYLNRLNELAGSPQPELPITNMGEDYKGGELKNLDFSVTRRLFNLDLDDLPEYEAVTKNVNVRTKPGTDGEVIETLPSGTHVTVVETGLGDNHAWNLVSYQGSDGLTHFAYVSSKDGGNEILTPVTQEGEEGVTREQVRAQQQFMTELDGRKPGSYETASRYSEGAYAPGAKVTIDAGNGLEAHCYKCAEDGGAGDYVAPFPNGTEVTVVGEPYITTDGWTAIKVHLDHDVTRGGTTIPAGDYMVGDEGTSAYYDNTRRPFLHLVEEDEGGDS